MPLTENLANTALSKEAKCLFVSLCSMPLSGQEHIARKLTRHIENLREEAKRNKILDLPTAESIFRTLSCLTTDFTNYNDEYRHILQAAVMYFIIDSDGISDTQDPQGFSDDAIIAQVVEATLKEETSELVANN